VEGAQAVGMKGILVKTGKYRENLATQYAITPDAVFESVSEVISLL
jgi:ribonucleotide monophosphatase NagD (HAD superfamily)